MHYTHAFIRHMWLKSRLCVFVSIHGHRHAHLFLSVLFFLVSLYFVLKSFFHLFLIPAMVPDEISMEDPLCNSSFGSMVSLDYVTPDTGYEPKDMEIADTNERNLATSSDIYFQNALEDTASFPNQSSSTQSDVTSRRRWSNSVLQNKIFIFEIIIHKYRIGLMIMESLFGCRRRIQTKISVLL